ncbi:hypothetical protein HDV05_003958 [Chytridiales sp. JEL 0842]|nr:hypothetical protein HDV05_003958 [Chytridiales sp. JEL 0842]
MVNTARLASAAVSSSSLAMTADTSAAASSTSSLQHQWASQFSSLDSTSSSNSLLFSSDALYSLGSSCVAAFTTRCITHPLDTIKTRIQHSPSSNFLTAIQSAPLRSLYNGLGISLLFSVPALGIYLGSYDACKTRFAESWYGHLDRKKGESSMAVHMGSAVVAEALSGLFWTPMEVIKNKLQVGVGAEGVTTATSRNISTMGLVKDIYRNEGIRGFFRGYWLTLGVFVPYTVCYFVSYEQLKARGLKYMEDRQSIASSSASTTRMSSSDTQNSNFTVYLVSSASAGALAGAVSNVLDVIKTRLQIAGGGQGTTSMLRIAADMYKNEGGITAFGRGMLARVLWVMPSVTISMTIFEVLKEQREQQKRALEGQS